MRQTVKGGICMLKKGSGVVLAPSYVWRLSDFVDEGRYQTTDIVFCFYNTIE